MFEAPDAYFERLSKIFPGAISIGEARPEIATSNPASRRPSIVSINEANTSIARIIRDDFPPELEGTQSPLQVAEAYAKLREKSACDCISSLLDVFLAPDPETTKASDDPTPNGGAA